MNDKFEEHSDLTGTEYEAPVIETILTTEQVELEVLYAGRGSAT